MPLWTTLCLGDEESEDVLRRALAFTADQAVRIWDDEWEDLDGQADKSFSQGRLKCLERLI